MTPEQFCYWLQGFGELNGAARPTAEQWKSINEHLALVFHKVTPSGPTYISQPPTITPLGDLIRVTCAEGGAVANPARLGTVLAC